MIGQKIVVNDDIKMGKSDRDFICSYVESYSNFNYKHI